MDRDVMMREAFGVREACFRFAMKPVKLSGEPYVRRGSSPPKSEMLPEVRNCKKSLAGNWRDFSSGLSGWYRENPWAKCGRSKKAQMTVKNTARTGTVATA